MILVSLGGDCSRSSLERNAELIKYMLICYYQNVELNCNVSTAVSSFQKVAKFKHFGNDC
jgi:hypothetical protein